MSSTTYAVGNEWWIECLDESGNQSYPATIEVGGGNVSDTRRYVPERRVMNDVFDRFPSFEIAAFRTFDDLDEAVERETGKGCEDDGSECFCLTVPDEEFVAIKSFVLVTGFTFGSECDLALLVHEVSHAVDGFLERIEEKAPGGEIRAYLMQAAMLSCVEQLKDAEKTKGRK